VSTPSVPEPAQLFLSILSSRLEEHWGKLLTELTARLGPLDYLSEPFPFVETRYYDRELGTPILRRVASFEALVEQDRLPEIKLWTNELESRHALGGLRQFNLDPGLLTHERLVLATGKNFTHRVYLGRGIWADLTLVYTRGAWQTLPWTFPDYAGPVLQAHLTRIRTLYAGKISLFRSEGGKRCPKA
jgi:hypothetical protein